MRWMFRNYTRGSAGDQTYSKEAAKTQQKRSNNAAKCSDNRAKIKQTCSKYAVQCYTMLQNAAFCCSSSSREGAHSLENELIL